MLKKVSNRFLLAISLIALVILVLPGMSHSQDCGNIDGSPEGAITLGDLTVFIDALYINPVHFPLADVADLDGVQGVTNNDLVWLFDHLSCSMAPLEECGNGPDSAFPVNPGCILEYRNFVASPMATEWTSELWLTVDGPFMGLAVPFVFDCPTAAETLDSITFPTSPMWWKIDNAGKRGLIGTAGCEGELPVGEFLLAELHFSLLPSAMEHVIRIDTSGYLPSEHTIVLSRPGPDGPTGEIPMLVGFGLSEPPPCMATGDVNQDTNVDMADISRLIEYLCISHDPLDVPYVADVNGDCILDTLDILALVCYNFGGCDSPPVLPVETCCDPGVRFCGEPDGALPIRDAEVVEISDDSLRVAVNESGDDGVRVYAGDPEATDNMVLNLENIDMSVENAELSVSVSGYTFDTKSGERSGAPGRIGMCGIANIGLGAIQIVADFNPIGDPDVLVKVFNNGYITGQNTVTGGGLIITGHEYLSYGLPGVTSMRLYSQTPPTFHIKLDRITELAVVGGSTLYGDELFLSAENATKTVTGVLSADVQAGFVGWFGLAYSTTNCCRGFTGNVDVDAYDLVTMGDLTVLIDHLFISLDPLDCEDEAFLDGEVDVTMGDLTKLIDFLFISLSPLPSCP